MHTTNLEIPKSAMTFSSSGVSVPCSDSLPGCTSKASGMPSASMSIPICTSGSGWCCLECPYILKPSSASISKKKLVQS